MIRELTPGGLAVFRRSLALANLGKRVDAKKSEGNVCLAWQKQCLDER
jgi:hypothetical protein